MRESLPWVVTQEDIELWRRELSSMAEVMKAEGIEIDYAVARDVNKDGSPAIVVSAWIPANPQWWFWTARRYVGFRHDHHRDLLQSARICLTEVQRQYREKEEAVQ